MKAFFLYFILSIIAVTAGLSGYYYYNNPEKKTLTDADRKGTGGSYIRLTQGVTHYQLGGPANGKVVVLFHGFAVPYFISDSTYHYLTKAGFRVLRYDAFGRGYSDRPEVVYDNALYYQQLTELLQKLNVKLPVNLVGISFGGRIATDFAAHYPQYVQKVVLVDPGYGSIKPHKPEFVAQYQQVVKSAKFAASQAEDFKYPDHYPNWAALCKAQMQYKGYAHALTSTMYHYVYDGRTSNALLNTRHKPVLLIWGKDDKASSYTYSDSIRRVLRAELFLVNDAGHLPATEQAAEVNAKIAAFLKQ